MERHETFADLFPVPVLEKAGLGAAEAATNCGPLCTSKQVAPGQPQATPDIHLHQSPSQGAQNQQPSGQLQTTSEQDPISFTSSISKGRSLQALDPAEANPALCAQHLHSISHAVIGGDPHSQPKGRPHTQTGQWQSTLSYNRRAHISYTRDIPGAPSSGDQGDCTTGSRRTPAPLGHPTKMGRCSRSA